MSVSLPIKIQVDLYHFNPDTDKKPSTKMYEVEVENKGIMILELLERIKAKNIPISFRRSCGEGVCGSDGVNINGKNYLACVTRIEDVLGKKGTKLKIRPLPGMPVIRDLIVDMSLFYSQYMKIKPYLINANPVDKKDMKERLQSVEDRAKLDGSYECILCACCSASCPSYWWNPDKYIGPAGLLQAYRFIADSRDTTTKERLEALSDHYSVLRCHNIMNCVDACPKGLNPAKAISSIRTKMLKL